MFTLFALLATLFKVPQEFYSGFGKSIRSFDHEPLITEITYRAISDHIVDQSTEWFDSDAVKRGDIIYLNIWYLEWFEKFVHDAIKEPYLLLTYDVGDWLPDPNWKRLIYDPKLAAWFCRNMVFSYHPKLFQIPMGQNDRYFRDEPLEHLKKMTHFFPYEKQYLLYMNHFPRPFGDRDKIVQLFEDEPYCFSRNHTGIPYGSIGRVEYFKELAASEFVLSPFGLETDCVRTWEALALKTVPIVEHTFLDPLFEGLPVVFVHDWKDINETFLKKQQLGSKSWDRAFIYPWREEILEVQKKVRQRCSSFAEITAMEMPQEELEILISLLDGHSTIIYFGFHSGVHALQLASLMPNLKQIYLKDFWYDLRSIRKFANNSPWTLSHKKIKVIPNKTFNSVFPKLQNEGYPIFCDFSYYRHSLLRDPLMKKWRHSLRKDLSDLYLEAATGTLICGNMIHDTYVKEVLQMLAKDHDLKIEEEGSYWFFKKS